eukprot:1137164-Pelagomonas_calceolata.AAC.7
MWDVAFNTSLLGPPTASMERKGKDCADFTWPHTIMGRLHVWTHDYHTPALLSGQILLHCLGKGMPPTKLPSSQFSNEINSGVNIGRHGLHLWALDRAVDGQQVAGVAVVAPRSGGRHKDSEVGAVLLPCSPQHILQAGTGQHYQEDRQQADHPPCISYTSTSCADCVSMLNRSDGPLGQEYAPTVVYCSTSGAFVHDGLQQ